MIWIAFIGLALVLYGAIRGGSGLLALAMGGRFAAYRQLAGEYAGRYEPRGMTDPPTVSFTARGGALVRVGLAPWSAGQPNHPRTRVVIRFREGIPFRLELAPLSRPVPPQPPKGTRLTRIGDARFDRSFLIRANDPEMARDFLTAPVRWAIEALGRLGPTGGLLVSINPERMLIQVDRDLGKTGDLLSQAVREALAVHDGLQAGVMARLGEGVAIVAAGPAPEEDSGPPLCKVCGEGITDTPRVVCTTCQTPHHADCWDFIGACSIFGCTGKTARPGHPVAASGPAGR